MSRSRQYQLTKLNTLNSLCISILNLKHQSLKESANCSYRITGGKRRHCLLGSESSERFYLHTNKRVLCTPTPNRHRGVSAHPKGPESKSVAEERPGSDILYSSPGRLPFWSVSEDKYVTTWSTHAV